MDDTKSGWLHLTYGTLPTEKNFLKAFDRIMQDRSYRFGNDKRVDNAELTANQIWIEILAAHEEGTDAALDWISCVFATLEIEWI